MRLMTGVIPRSSNPFVFLLLDWFRIVAKQETFVRQHSFFLNVHLLQRLNELIQLAVDMNSLTID